MTKPIRIRLTKDSGSWEKGTELGVASEAVANRLYPDHEVVSHVDGSTYEEPAAASSEASADEKPAKKD